MDDLKNRSWSNLKKIYDTCQGKSGQERYSCIEKELSRGNPHWTEPMTNFYWKYSDWHAERLGGTKEQKDAERGKIFNTMGNQYSKYHTLLYYEKCKGKSTIGEQAECVMEWAKKESGWAVNDKSITNPTEWAKKLGISLPQSY